MKTTNYPGIDYGVGQANIDSKTGCRYGVISQHTVGQAWFDEAEPDYGKPHCPNCGNEVCESEEPYCKDYCCKLCEESFWSDVVYGDEPCGWYYEDNDYNLTDCLNNDIFVLRSPFYTHAQFCSPCVPGAGNLDSPCADGPKTLCLGHDWFENGVAPYPVFSVETNEEIKAS